MLQHFLVILLIWPSFSECTPLGKQPERGVDGLKLFLERKCLKNANASVLLELEEAVIFLPLCIRYIPHQSQSASVHFYNTICSERSKYRCLEDVIKKMNPCFDNEEKYLSDFLLSSFNKSTEALCEGGEEAFIEKMLKLETATKTCPSLTNYLPVSGNICFGGINLNPNYKPDSVITKSFLCSQVRELVKCLVEDFKNICKDDIAFRFLSLTVQPYLDWCTRNNS